MANVVPKAFDMHVSVEQLKDGQSTGRTVVNKFPATAPVTKRGENRGESACDALLRALHAPPGGPDDACIARGCSASLCPAP